MPSSSSAMSAGPALALVRILSLTPSSVVRVNIKSNGTMVCLPESTGHDTAHASAVIVRPKPRVFDPRRRPRCSGKLENNDRLWLYIHNCNWDREKLWEDVTNQIDQEIRELWGCYYNPRDWKTPEEKQFPHPEVHTAESPVYTDDAPITVNSPPSPVADFSICEDSWASTPSSESISPLPQSSQSSLPEIARENRFVTYSSTRYVSRGPHASPVLEPRQRRKRWFRH